MLVHDSAWNPGRNVQLQAVLHVIPISRSLTSDFSAKVLNRYRIIAMPRPSPHNLLHNNIRTADRYATRRWVLATLLVPPRISTTRHIVTLVVPDQES